MRGSNRPVAFLAAGPMLACALFAGSVTAQEVVVGNAATVVGDVRLSNADIKKPRKIERKERVAWGDLIDTAKKSQLQILLLDRSTFGIGARSRVRIDHFVYDPNAGRSLFVTFVKGALRFFSGRQEGENRADIQTPAGRIGIRGTALDLLVGKEARNIAEAEAAVGNVRSNKDEATLAVLRGPGAGTAGGLTVGLAEVEAAGVTVTLDRPGLAAYIPRNGAPPIGPFSISNQGLSQVQDELAPEVARVAKGGGGLLKALVPVVVGAAAVGILSSGDDDKTPDRTPTTNRTPKPSPQDNTGVTGTTNNPSRPTN